VAPKKVSKVEADAAKGTIPGVDRLHFYTLTMLAQRWQTSRKTLYRRVQAGRLKAIRLSGLKVSAKEVERVEADGL